MDGCRVKKTTGQSGHCSNALYISATFASLAGSANIASSWTLQAIGGGVSKRA